MSQIGYMFLAVGVGAYSAGFFHLLAHAFFKALLFMAAGNVIHAMHDEQDMRKYGRPVAAAAPDVDHVPRRLPVARGRDPVRRLLLQGADPRRRLLAAGQRSACTVWGIGFVTALITGFYTGRMWWMSFCRQALAAAPGRAPARGAAGDADPGRDPRRPGDRGRLHPDPRARASARRWCRTTSDRVVRQAELGGDQRRRRASAWSRCCSPACCSGGRATADAVERASCPGRSGCSSASTTSTRSTTPSFVRTMDAIGRARLPRRRGAASSTAPLDGTGGAHRGGAASLRSLTADAATSATTCSSSSPARVIVAVLLLARFATIAR